MDMQETLRKHELWLENPEQEGAERADLRGAYLRGAYLRGADLQSADLQSADLQSADLQSADLRGAYLQEAYLQGANLRGAYLQGANLRGADLQSADLRGADLQEAYLQGANLRGAYLQGANLQEAYLRGADLQGTYLPDFQIPPQEGDFLAYKAGKDCVIKVKVPAGAKRTSSLIGRKCRAEFVQVISIKSLEGEVVQDCQGWRDNTFIYRTHEIIHADSYNPDIRVECTNGIHFFMTEQEAINWLR